MSVLLFVPVLSAANKMAQPAIQPIIQSKVYAGYQAKLTTYGKPIQIITGAEDECNDGFFPDDYRFQSFTIRADGLIREVYLQPNNGLIFYGKKLDSNTTEADFKNQFKGKFTQATAPHTYNATAGQDEYKSITFYFKNGKFEKYNLWMDDC